MHTIINVGTIKSNTTSGYFIAKELYSYSVPMIRYVNTAS